jgi:CelD/BcsL family acetyltransferase involved in cellulose biosynthesis
MSVREINQIDELASLRESWRALLSATPGASFFQSLEWLEVYWRHFGGDQRLRVLVIEEGDEVTGILPLVVRPEMTRVGRLHFLTYPLDHWGSFYGPIGAAHSEILAAGLEYLNSTGIEADMFELRWLGNDPEECDTVEQLLSSTGHAPLRSEYEPTAIIDLSETWDDYLAARKSKWRSNLRRSQRLLGELGEITYVRHRPEACEDNDPRWDYFDECLRIASASWQGSSTTGTTLSHEDVAPFLRDAHVAAVRSGCVDMNLLCLNDKPIAFAYNYLYQGYVYGLRLGYDPNIECKGAGSVLTAMAIEDSFHRGDWRYDLGPRHLDCKRQLVTHVLPIYRLSSSKSWSVRQKLLLWKRRWDTRAKSAAAAL